MINFTQAWRNLWRNKRRTAITMAAVTFSTAILVVSYCLMMGLLNHAVHSATNLVVGQAQVHAPGYRADRSMYKSVPHPERILEAARRAGVGAAPRAYGFGLAAVGKKSAGALFWGVDPAAERRAFELATHLNAGGFLPDAPRGGLVLGRKLARSLSSRAGDEVVVVVQAADGSMGNELFKVTGIFKTVGASVDASAALMHKDDFQRLFASGGRVHEVALNSGGRLGEDQVAALAKAAAPKMETLSWRRLLPALNDMIAMFDAFLWVFGFIFVLAAGMGVMNTMLMATHERVREFGVLKALGASGARIAAGVAAEAGLMSLAGSLLGAGLGLAGAWHLSRHGLDTSAIAGGYTVGGVAFDPMWRASLEPSFALAAMGLMMAICLLVSLYPALVAARLDPVRAMNRV